MSNTWSPFKPKGHRGIATRADGSQPLPILINSVDQKLKNTFPIVDPELAKVPMVTEAKPVAPAIKAPITSRVIPLVHYQQILTAIQVIADATTIVLSFLAGYWLWKLVGPAVAIDLYEPEAINRYYSFVGVTMITSLVGMEVHGLYQAHRSLMNVREFELILKTWVKACLFTL